MTAADVSRETDVERRRRVDKTIPNFRTREARNRFPVYIPTKSRWQPARRLTMRTFDALGIDYFAIVEASQIEQYVDAGVDRARILELPERYLDEYDTLDDAGRSRSVGPGAARNFAWDHAASLGAEYHWCADDNVRGLAYYAGGAIRLSFADDTAIRMIEDATLQYANVAMSGPQYASFVPRPRQPVTFNTRVYSFNLIRTDAPYRWRGRYNEDTILSLDMLKDGWCTTQYNHVLQRKLVTQAVPGGNTEAFYAREGTYLKSEMLWRAHPDVTRVVTRFGRVHHTVDYRPFAKNLLQRRDDAPPLPEYGLYTFMRDDAIWVAGGAADAVQS